MSCRGCDDKTSRYGGVKIKGGDVDMSTEISEEEYARRGAMTQPTDPMSAFFSAQQMSYEELKNRQDFSRNAAKTQADHIINEMTDAMKQVHIEELISTANSDLMSIPNMTPDQALVSLHDIISKGSIHFLDSLYPGLREEVEKRYSSLRADALPGRKTE